MGEINSKERMMSCKKIDSLTFKKTVKNKKNKKEELLTNFKIEEEENEALEIFHLKKYLLIEYLCDQYPKYDIENIKNKIKEIIYGEEKQEIELNFSKRKEEKTMTDRINDLKNRKETGLEKIKAILNKITIDHVESFAEEILKIKIDSISEMKEIVCFLFRKAITEKTYSETYAKLIKILKEDFRCEEEKTLLKKQSCFFGYFLTLLKTKLEERHSYQKAIKIDRKDKTQGKYEEELENRVLDQKEEERDSRGSMDFFLKLFTNKMISFSTLKKTLDIFFEPSAENMDLLGRVLLNSTKHLQVSHADYLKKIYEFVKENSTKYGLKMEVILGEYLEESEKYYKGKNKAKTTIYEDITEEDPNKEMNEIIFYFDDLNKTLQMIKEEADYQEVYPGIIKKSNKTNKKEFYNVYFYNCVTHYKNSEKLIKIFSKYIKERFTGLIEVLGSIKENLSEYRYDNRCAEENFNVLLFFLKEEKIIKEEELEKLRTEKFLEDCEKLILEKKLN